MAVTKEDVEQARQDAKQEKNQRKMEEDIYGKQSKPVALPPVKKAKGGTASSRADGCCQRGKTKGKMY